MEVFEAIAKRSSARAYAQTPLTEEELEKIITAGLQAPTGRNEKEIRFSVVKGGSPILEEIDEQMRKDFNINKGPHNFYYEAPCVILLSAKTGFKWSAVDAGIAVENMSIAAEALGLGNLIIGCIYDTLNGERKDYFNKALKVPEGYNFEIALAVGHKTDNKAPHEYNKDEQVKIID
ncbi:MAG: nitroreductase family protein [Lachnospiraceae bacterium]|nr:nitroreductase family protein [Lachnospiraceae bacterium]